MNSLIQKKAGYSLVELLLYISIFTVLSLTVTQAIVTMTNSFRIITVNVDLVQSSTVMERMSREIRRASAINSISPTSVTLDTKDSGGADTTVALSLSGTDIQISQGGTLLGNLNSSKIEVTSLALTEVTTTAGKAVKVQYSVKSLRDKNEKIYNFYNTITLRGSY